MEARSTRLGSEWWRTEANLTHLGIVRASTAGAGAVSYPRDHEEAECGTLNPETGRAAPGLLASKERVSADGLRRGAGARPTFHRHEPSAAAWVGPILSEVLLTGWGRSTHGWSRFRPTVVDSRHDHVDEIFSKDRVERRRGPIVHHVDDLSVILGIVSFGSRNSDRSSWECAKLRTDLHLVPLSVWVGPPPACSCT